MDPLMLALLPGRTSEEEEEELERQRRRRRAAQLLSLARGPRSRLPVDLVASFDNLGAQAALLGLNLNDLLVQGFRFRAPRRPVPVAARGR